MITVDVVDSSVLEDSFSGTRLKREGTILCLDPSRRPIEGRFLAILLKYILDSTPLSLFLLMVSSNLAIAEWMLAFLFLVAMVMIGVWYL